MKPKKFIINTLTYFAIFFFIAAFFVSSVQLKLMCILFKT